MIDAPRIRIAHVATRFLHGGSERAIGALIEALPEDRFQHELIVGSDSDMAMIRQLCGDLRVTVEPALKRSPNPFWDLVALYRLTGHLGRGGFDVVHTCQSKAGILGRCAARLNSVSFLVHSVAMANFGPGFGTMASHAYVIAERLASRWTDQYLTFGTDLRDRFVAAGIAPEAAFKVIRSAVDVDAVRELGNSDQDELRDHLDLPRAAKIVLFAGSLDERKGAAHLPDYIDRVRELCNGHVLLLIAGVGPLEDDLKRRFAKASGVRFLGYTSRLLEYQVAADCLVQMSSAEGLSTVTVQAAAAGTPFVSYPVDGVHELIALGAIGYIVSAGDFNQAAQATVNSFGRRGSPTLDLDQWKPEVVRDAYQATFAGRLERQARLEGRA